MKKLNLGLVVMLAFLLCSCNYAFVDVDDVTNEAVKIAEKAYFEGQKDAIEGDVRIKLNSDSCYIWVTSPWDNGDDPIYIPTVMDSKK